MPQPPQDPVPPVPLPPIKPIDPIAPKTSFEEAQEEFEALVQRIEAGELSLEESMAAYKRGKALFTHCSTILDKAEQTFNDLTEKAKG